MSSESAKTPKSSPESSGDEKDFSAFAPGSPVSAGPRFVSYGMKTKDWILERFESGDAFFEAMEANPVLGRSLRQRIESRAKQLMAEREAEWRRQIEQESRAEARTKGVDQGLAEGRHVITKLDSICREIVAARARLLAHHQKAWADAFAQVVERLILPRGPEAALRLSEWLEARRTEAAARGKLLVLLSPREAETLGRALGEKLGEQRWRVEADASLKTGEIRVEWDEGGVLLSPQAALEQIQSCLASVGTEDSRKEAA